MPCCCPRYRDSVLLVIRAGSTPKPVVQNGIEQLRNVNAHIMGAILNGVKTGRDSYYYYQYYYYYYGDDGNKQEKQSPGQKTRQRPVQLIDLHCHILPGIDDGPADIGESLEMARQAVLDGIHTIVATPHSQNGMYVNSGSDICRHVRKINRILAGGRHSTGGAVRRRRAYPSGYGS